ncbi:hypothetical protein LCGC14_1667960 [marine sediment metagenome]|uniref:Uncharacterized protein n=1 Tax=marine sediment metagenome TaxID=412755 RepID=A0A0F9K7Z5_9ZZZZ
MLELQWENKAEPGIDKFKIYLEKLILEYNVSNKLEKKVILHTIIFERSKEGREKFESY